MPRAYPQPVRRPAILGGSAQKAIKIVVVALLVGCTPSQDELRSADPGSYPENYKQIVFRFYYDNLHSPRSATFERTSKPVATYWGNPISGFNYAWLVCVTLTSLDVRDGYAGTKTDALLIRDGHVVEFLPDGKFHGTDACKSER